MDSIPPKNISGKVHWTGLDWTGVEWTPVPPKNMHLAVFWVESTGVQWSPVESIWTLGGTEKYWTKHKQNLLMYHDKRFQTDFYFPMIAFNHEQLKAGVTGSFLLAL